MRSLFPEFLRISRENGSTFPSDGDLRPWRSKIAQWLIPTSRARACGMCTEFIQNCIQVYVHVEKKSEKGEGAGEATHHLVGLLGDSTRLLHRGMYIAGTPGTQRVT